MPTRPNPASRRTRSSIGKLSSQLGRSFSHKSPQLGLCYRHDASSLKLRYGSVQRLRPSYALPVTSQPKRTFSKNSYQRSIWDEDDEVPKPAPVKRGVRPVQSTPPAHARSTAHRHLGGLIRSRVATKQLAEGYISLEKKFNSLPSYKSLVDVFIQLKYKHVDDLLSECAASLQGYDAEAKSLSKSIHEHWDLVTARNTHRVSKANVVTQECVAEWEILSFSILKRIASVVSQNTDRVLQAEKITQNYIAEVTHLSSSILGLERIQTAVSKTEKSIEIIDHNFCATVFTQIPKWTQQLAKFDENIRLWQRHLRISENKLLEPRVNISELSIRRLKNTLEYEFLRPRKVARRRIDKVIASMEEVANTYTELQRKSTAVRDNYDVKSLCFELSHNENFSSEDRLAFRNFSDILHRDSLEFSPVAHQWRSLLRERWRVDHALKDSQLWSLTDFTRQAASSNHAEYLTNWALSSFDSKIPRIIDTNARMISHGIQRKYNSLWTSTAARSPELNIYWRQLDVIGPIQLVEYLTRRLSNDVWYLHSSLKGELGSLWAWMPRQQVARVTTLIGLWSNQFNTHRSELRAEYSQLVYLNWLRLQSESRLHSMNETAHLAGRFEVVNPMSQDLSRFAQWADRMAHTAQEAYIYYLSRIKMEPSFWEKLYDTLESVDRNPSLALELGSSIKPTPKMIPTPNRIRKSSLDKKVFTHEARPLGGRQGMRIPRIPLPPHLLDEMWKVWVEFHTTPSSVDSTSDQSSQADRAFPSLAQPLEIRELESKLPKYLMPKWQKFKHGAINQWRSREDQEDIPFETDLSLQNRERQTMKKWLTGYLELFMLYQGRGRMMRMDALWQTKPALDSWADPGKRLELERERGPRPVLTHQDWHLGFEMLRECTTWATSERDLRKLPFCTEDMYNDWLDFQHTTSELWGMNGGSLPKRMEVARFMKAWAWRQKQLYRESSNAQQRAQMPGDFPSQLSFEPSTKPKGRTKKGMRKPMLRSKQRRADPPVNQASQEENKAIHGPPPNPSGQTTERNIAESELIKPHGDGFHSTTQRTKLKPHEMAQRVRSILITDSDPKSAGISPAKMEDQSNVDTGPKLAEDKPRASDQVFNNLFANPKRQVPREVGNRLPGVRPQSGSHAKRKGGSIPRTNRLRQQDVASVFGTKSHSKNERGYSTDATCYRVNYQQAHGVSHDPLSERSLGDERSPGTSTETRPAGENVSADEFAPHSDCDSGANDSTPLFWSHSSQQSPGGQKLIVHYCRTLRSTEETVQHFLGSKVIGFDMEWKSSASSWDSIQNNVSLIQIANEERIALFHVALFKPARTLTHLVSPSLKRLIESPDVTKVGVSIKADCTRLRKYLGIDAKATFELSHLFKLVKHGKDNPKLVNKRGVNLSDQMEEHFGLPLDKNEDVRCGDWARALTYRQVQYAATDPYACIRLFNAMEAKRRAMDPMPPRPAHAELNQPIVLPLE